jgi:hypothetical protein
MRYVLFKKDRNRRKKNHKFINNVDLCILFSEHKH